MFIQTGRLNAQPTVSQPWWSYFVSGTSCRWAAATICPHPAPPSGRRSTSRRVVSHAQCVPTLTAAAAWHIKAAMSKVAWWPWPLNLESGVWVTCDVGYLCTNFSLPRPLFLELGPMYATDRCQTASLLNAPAYGVGA